MPEGHCIRREKIVRDEIGKRISRSSERAKIRIARTASERRTFLRLKGYEEWQELCMAILSNHRAKIIEELADSQEVLLAIAREHGIAADEVYRVRMRKVRKWGGFAKGYILHLN